VPKPKRLQDWYKKMLDRAILERVVIDYKVKKENKGEIIVFCL
jgi:hypothetical protein